MKKVLLYRLWQISVRRLVGGEIQVTTNHLDKYCEFEGRLVVIPSSLEIISASIEVSRGFWKPGTYDIPGLVGVSAYVGAGKYVRQATAQDKTRLWADVMLECVKGILQAEGWIAVERGFASAEDYEDYFWREFVNTCVYYSHPEIPRDSFNIHVADQVRGELLFSRYKHTSLEQMGNSFFLVGALFDSFHQMKVDLQVDDHGKVLSAIGQVLRSPHRICCRGEERLKELQAVTVCSAHNWQSAAGGPEGCIHLGDIVRELGRTWEYWQEWCSQ